MCRSLQIGVSSDWQEMAGIGSSGVITCHVTLPSSCKELQRCDEVQAVFKSEGALAACPAARCATNSSQLHSQALNCVDMSSWAMKPPQPPPDALTETSIETTLWTIDDVARYARCSVRHVTTLREQGLPYRKLGHLVRFSPEAVKRWFECVA